ncbi:3-oxoadipate enol-lactonase [Aurantiacibacter rhizosphaerae]|uniref:3-oxoadipate enol-lactonase n=1 Tax=Aurantiacibacter rhizosphaerae TaxID=2691582 RepID=A0A844XHM9_9SPHN|nr:3-oxoadipate enol-lactonase [Aurantiacibacter rhizosphaerae]MWV29058.1 3-oxoadipate enol-lactonase [Aurantiacibacter rhizosphaerae]
MMDQSFITCGDGCQIHFRLDGANGAPILVLSNSLGTAMSMWEPQMARLRQHFRVLRYDQRGHGLSDCPRGAYSMDRLGRDVIELLDTLELDRVNFCGLSLGGMTGQWLGIRTPERFERLILANTSPYMGPPSAWDARITLVYREGLAMLAQASAERWFTPDFCKERPDKVALFQARLAGGSQTGYAGCCAAIRDMDMRPSLGLVKVPCLVIGGESDPATPREHSEALHEGIPDAALKMLPAAHLSNVEQPHAFTDAVIDFIRD